jgi:transcriptional regulator with XRE-family HTH domain
MSTYDGQTTKHEGKNVKRLREILGVKQETLAAELGINQQKMSFIEQKEKIDDEVMEQISKALNVPMEAIRNFDEEVAINIIATTFNSHDNSFATKCTFNINPIEQWVEALKKNEDLYERLLQSEREKVQLLEKILQERK